MILFLDIPYQSVNDIAMTTDTTDANVSSENQLPALQNVEIVTDKVLNALHSNKTKVQG